MRRYDAVLFDVDDTLLDFEASEEAACRHVFDSRTDFSPTPFALFAGAFRSVRNATWELYMAGAVGRADIFRVTFEQLAAMGYLDGNLALQGIADIVRHSIRSVDSAYRYGGEEFVILMPEASPTDAHKAAERIRASVERNSARDHRHFRCVVTLSGGVASFEDRVSDPKNLLLLADLAMYQAKKSGKNTIYVLESLASQKRTAPGSPQ